MVEEIVSIDGLKLKVNERNEGENELGGIVLAKN